jgi:hypothetical protein
MTLILDVIRDPMPDLWRTCRSVSNEISISRIYVHYVGMPETLEAGGAGRRLTVPTAIAAADGQRGFRRQGTASRA